MEPNGPFPMQYYDQGHGNSNGFPPNFSQSPSISSPNSNNSLSSPAAPYGFRPMENGISRYMNEQFDGQNFGQHPAQFFQQSAANSRRNDPNFAMKNQAQGFPNQMQQHFATSRDNYSSGNFNSFMSPNMKERLQSEGEMLNSSAQNFSQVRMNPTTSVPRDAFAGGQMQMGMMENSGMPQPNQMPQQNQMGQSNQMSQPPDQFPQPYPQQFQNRQEFARNQFYGQDNPGFGNNGIRPEGFNQPFPQSPSPQTPTQGPMEQRPSGMFARSGPAGPGFPVNKGKRNENPMNPTQPMNESQRQAAMMAAAAAVRAAAVASNRQGGRDFPPGTGYPNTLQYGQRPFMPSPDMLGSPFSASGAGMASPLGKELSAASPAGHGMQRQGRGSTESPMNQGSMSSRNSSNSLSFSPNVEQSSPGFGQQTKIQCGSPSSIKTASQPETLASVRPGSGSDHSKYSDSGSGEVQIKKEPNLSAGCSVFPSDNDNLSATTPTPRSDVDEIVDAVNELEKEAESKIKKEKEEPVEQKPNPNDFMTDEKPLHNDKEKNLLAAPCNKTSAPPTPLSTMSGVSPAPSPLPDDLDLSNASPSWPNTPTSPGAKRLLQSQSPARFDQLSKLYDLSEDEERRTFLDKYLAFMSVNGTPVTKVPVVSKQPLDLYRLFRLVLEKGGLQEVLKRKQFREVLKSLNLPSTNSSLAYTVKNQYTKYLLPFETKMKGLFLKAWQSDGRSSEPNVPTIALNDTLPSAMKDGNQGMNKMPRSSQGGPNDAGLRDWQMSGADANAQPPFQMTNRMPSQPMPFSQNNAMSGAVGTSFNQTRPTRASYANSPDMSGYPMNSFMRFPRQNFQRNPNQPYPAGQPFPGKPMQQNPLSPSWPRNFQARPGSGPPELFPEGLTRPPWMQQQQQQQQQVPSSRNQQFMSKEQRLSNKLKGFHPSQKDQETPWPTNKGPNIPLKPKRSSTPSSSDPHSNQAPSSKSSLHQTIKRESLIFPPNSVENTKPVLNKRQRLTSKELGPVEAWRIMMSLKSGMLAECTWAIDTLNILLHDDKTISYFHLPQLPGLLDTLMDHFRRCCIESFDILNDVEAPIVIEKDHDGSVKCEDPAVERTSKETLNDIWVGVVKNAKSSYTATVASFCVPESDKDIYNVTSDTWKAGGADDTAHIQLCFPTQVSSSCEKSSRSTDVKRKPFISDKGVEQEAEEGTRNDMDKANGCGVPDGSITRSDAIYTNNEVSGIARNTGNDGIESSETEPNVNTNNKTGNDVLKCVEKGSDLVSNVSKRKLDSLKDDEAVTKCETIIDSLRELKRDKLERIHGKNSLDGALRNHVKPSMTMRNLQHSFSKLKENGTSKEWVNPGSPTVNGIDKAEDRSPCNTKCDSDNSNGETKNSRTITDETRDLPDESRVKTEIKDDETSSSESRQSSNLASFETFKAMQILEEGLSEPKVKQDEPVEELCNTLELDLDYTKHYLDTSKEFIGYLKNRLTVENRGKVPCQEAYAPENSPFCSRENAKVTILSRLIAISNIFRSLSFVSGNDNDLASHSGLLLLMGRLLLHHHEHPVTDHSEFRLTQEDSDINQPELLHDATTGPFLEALKAVQENVLVILANVAGQIDLSRYQEHIILPLLDGLLHWVVCQSSTARDPMPTAPAKYALSPKRLALETLAKLSITDSNVDLILATPPTSRLKLVFKELVKAIGIRTSIPIREFAVVVLDNLAHGDSIVPLILEQKSCIGSVLLFLEEAERNTSSYVSAGGVVQPGLSAEDVCGTSVNMLRRAADILLCLARGCDDRAPFLPFVQRLLSLATSQMMDTSVLKILSEIMYELR